jgi:hypothetical protein
MNNFGNIMNIIENIMNTFGNILNKNLSTKAKKTIGNRMKGIYSSGLGGCWLEPERIGRLGDWETGRLRDWREYYTRYNSAGAGVIQVF